MNVLIERTSIFSIIFSRLDPVTRDHLCFHVLHVTLSCLVALRLACQSSFSSSFLFTLFIWLRSDLCKLFIQRL